MPLAIVCHIACSFVMYGFTAEVTKFEHYWRLSAPSDRA